MNRKLDFLIIGAQKAGTTSLYDWISQHPDIYAPQHLKDYPFFRSDKLYFKGEYFLHSKFGKVSHNKIVGGGSVQYIFFKKVPERIYHYNRHIKLILMIRDPVARAISAYRYAKERGLENRPFTEVINYEIKYGDKAYTDYSEANQKFYLSRGLYYKQIEKYLRLFNKDQLLIIPFKDLINNKKKVTKQVFQFLNVYLYDGINFQKKNETKGGAKFVYVNKIIYSKSFKNNFFIVILRKILSQRLKHFILTYITIFNRRKVKSPENFIYTEEDMILMKEYFKKDIYKLKSFLNFSVEDWLQH